MRRESRESMLICVLHGVCETVARELECLLLRVCVCAGGAPEASADCESVLMCRAFRLFAAW